MTEGVWSRYRARWQASGPAGIGEALRAVSPTAPGTPEQWVKDGWNPERLTILAGLVDWAIAHATHLGRNPRGLDDARWGAAFPLIKHWEILNHHMIRSDDNRWIPLPTDQMVPGIALLAAAPTEDAYTDVSYAITAGPSLHDSADPEVFTRRLLPLDPLGALAWAAGLTLPELTAQQAAGTLDVNTLLTMAGLRGWHLPEVIAAW